MFTLLALVVGFVAGVVVAKNNKALTDKIPKL